MVLTQSFPKILQSAELKLLYRPFAAPNLQRNFADTLLLNKTHFDDPALILRQFLQQAEDLRAALDFVEPGFLDDFGRRDFLLPRHALRSIREGVSSYPVQPRRERHPSPFIA